MTKETPKDPKTQRPRDRARPSTLLAYLQLFRLPNVFTAMADITAGFLFVRGELSPLPSFVLLLVASSLLYIAGMVLNDLFDVEQDTKERPERPIPSGRISRSTAQALGFGMLLLGVGIAWVVGFIPAGGESAAVPWRSGVIGSLLVACIVAYDAVMKRTPAGPVFMGACRMLNILLGMSVAVQNSCGGPVWLLRFEVEQLLIAGSVGIYIAGVTWFARTEAVASNRGQLSGGLVTMVVGLLLLASYPLLFQNGLIEKPLFHFRGLNPLMWQLLIVLLGFTIARSAATAVFNPHPQRVQNAVKTAIMSLIVLDAAICLIVGPFFAIGVLVLLAPMLLLGRFVYST